MKQKKEVKTGDTNETSDAMRLHDLDRKQVASHDIQLLLSSLSKVFAEENPWLVQTSVNFILHIIQYLCISFSQKFHKSTKIQVKLPNRQIN